jgi:hypothetical protein
VAQTDAKLHTFVIIPTSRHLAQAEHFTCPTVPFVAVASCFAPLEEQFHNSKIRAFSGEASKSFEVL